MTKEDMILAGVERVEAKQEQQRLGHEAMVAAMSSIEARLAEIEAGHGRHRDEHRRRDWWLFTGIVGLLGAAAWYIWEHR